MKGGIFIVIDGSDGSGKATQTELLSKRLTQAGYSVLALSYPRYGEPSAALVEAYLRGEFGTPADTVNPYLASTFYAADRFACADTIRQALENGSIVIADRYVVSNMAHQGGKIDDPAQRKEFILWEDDFEHAKGNLPRPDINIILHVPTDISLKLIKQRGEAKDIHEKDEQHLRRAEETYLEIKTLIPSVEVIECTRTGNLIERQEINDEIWSKVSKLI